MMFDEQLQYINDTSEHYNTTEIFVRFLHDDARLKMAFK